MFARLDELRRRHAAGEHTAAVRLAQGILRDPTGLTERERFDVARTGTNACMGLKDHFGAQQFAESELKHATAAGDPDLVAVAQYHRGTVFTYIGSSSEALEALAAFTAIDMPSRPALDRYRAGCWFNIGSAHLQRREYERAAAALAEARSVYELQGDVHGAAECFLQEAWALMLADRFEQAGQHLGRATALLSAHPDDRLQLYCICHRAFYAYRQGDHARAISLCEEVFQPGRPAVTDHHLSEAAWITGECCLALGSLDLAEQMATAAKDHGMKAGFSWLINRANDLRGRIRAAAGEQTA